MPQEKLYLNFFALLVQIGTPVRQVEHGENERENDAGNDIDAFRTESVRRQPRTAARFGRQDFIALLGPLSSVLNEDDFGARRNKRFLEWNHKAR